MLDEPLVRRRAALAELVGAVGSGRLALSEGLVGPGRRFFEEVVAGGHEGVMAKHLAGGYRPGRRSSLWRKIKPVRSTECVVIGYTGALSGVRSLLLAALGEGGELSYVAEAALGFGGRVKERLGELPAPLGRSRPFVACPKPGRWVEPEIFCRVGYASRTAAGRLRDARFRGLLEADAPSR